MNNIKQILIGIVLMLVGIACLQCMGTFGAHWDVYFFVSGVGFVLFGLILSIIAFNFKEKK